MNFFMNTYLSQPHNDRDHRPSDVSNTNLMDREHEADLRYVSGLGWMVWNGVCWRQDDTAARALMMSVVKTVEHEGSDR